MTDKQKKQAKNKNKVLDKVKPETKEEIIKDIEKTGVPETQVKVEENLDEKVTKETDEKKEEKLKEMPKKTEAVVNAYNIPISTKASAAICKFIKGKNIKDAIEYLEYVVKLKKPIPMKGEIPHRKGKIMSGRFPQKTARNFIVILKSLAANASFMDEPTIHLAVANMASKPYGRFGRTRKKRTHIKLVAKEKKGGKNGRKKNS